ncbi:hypothetical protein PJI17_31295, partial [Mycobacterium kansasii]
GVIPPTLLVHPAGNVGASGLFKQFQRFRPPTFAGTHRPEEAKYWLDHISKMLKPLQYTEAEQVELVTYMFEKEASLRWDSVLQTIAVGYVWTWEAFDTSTESISPHIPL